MKDSNKVLLPALCSNIQLPLEAARMGLCMLGVQGQYIATYLVSNHNDLGQLCQRVLYIGLVLRQGCQRSLDLARDLQQTIH